MESASLIFSGGQIKNMSTLFFDQYINLDKVEKSIKKVSSSRDEAMEMWMIVDEIIHHRVLGCILGHLPKENHHEFLDLLANSPHNEELTAYLKGKIKEDVALLIKNSVALLALELTEGLVPDSTKARAKNGHKKRG